MLFEEVDQDFFPAFKLLHLVNFLVLLFSLGSWFFKLVFHTLTLPGQTIYPKIVSPYSPISPSITGKTKKLITMKIRK